MQSEPTTEVVHKLLTSANLFRMRGNVAEAARLCQQAVDADPENGTAHDLMGDLLQAQGNLEEAMTHFKRAFALEQRPATEEKIARLALRIDAQKHLGTIDLGEDEPAEPGRRRNPSLATALSLFFPGLGQIYNGDYGKGVGLFIGATFLAGFAVAMVLWANGDVGTRRRLGVGLMVPPSVWLMALAYGVMWAYSMVEAAMSAAAINLGNRRKRKSGWEV